jgi:hypothetical protein
MGQVLLIHEVYRSHITTRHSWYNSSGRVISPSQRPTWQHTTLTTNVLAPGGIRTHILSRQAAADLSLRPRDQWDRRNWVD